MALFRGHTDTVYFEVFRCRRVQDGQKNEREVDNSDDAAMANQKRMNADPLEVMLSNMGYRITNVLDDDGSGEREPGEGSAVGCRAS